MFTMLSAIALVTGAILGRAFRSSVPVATTLVLVIASLGFAVVSIWASMRLGYDLSRVLLVPAAAVATLQFGFLLGLGSGDVVSRLRSFLSSTVRRETQAPARD